MLELLRLLTQLRPRFRPLPKAPCPLFAQWCLGQGLGPLAGYNLEYALPQLPAPRAVKEQLLLAFWAAVGSNTSSLGSFKKALGPLEGRRVVLFGAWSLVDALGFHVGFRPLQEASVLVAQEDTAGFASYMRACGYTEEVSFPHAVCALSDGLATVGLFNRLPGVPRMPPALLGQAAPKRVFGPSVFALGLEDSLLALCARQYAEGYSGPWIDWVEVRQALLSPEVEAQSLKAKAQAWGIPHALYASLTALGHVFGGVEQAFCPEVPAEWEALVSRWAEAFAKVPEAVLEGREIPAKEEERRAFEAMAAKAPQAVSVETN